MDIAPPEIPITIIPLRQSFEGQRTINMGDVPVLIGRLIDTSENVAGSIKFTSKVVSRRHAQLTYLDGKVIHFIDK